MINRFKDYLKASGKSDNTVLAYAQSVDLMHRAINKADTDITFLDLVDWQKTLENKSTSTVHGRVVAVKAYFDFLLAAGVVNSNPATALQTKKVQNKVKPDPEADVVIKLIDSARSNRDKALIATLASTGMRFAEATSMTIEQFNQRRFTVIGKGDKPREIYINDQTKAYIDRYLRCRVSNSPLVFATSGDAALTNSAFNKNLKNIAKRADLPYWHDVSAHFLRHVFATRASQAGVPVADIGHALGHSDYAKVTSRYIHTPQSVSIDAMNIAF